MTSRLLLAMTLAFTLMACGSKPAAETPVAAPSLSLNHTKAPLGSPIEVTYKFQVAPAASFAKDYRVLVHFLDADDELMWTDDHMPPVPTTRWKPGQAIEYRRTVFVPLYPYIGDATISVGLYAPDTNERLAMSGQSTGQREYRVGRLRLQPQTDNVFIAYVEGWHGPETAAENQTVEWQWTKKDATLRFRNPKQNATFYLHYDGQPSMLDSVQTVSLYLGEAVVDTFQVTTPDDVIRRIPLKTAQFGPDDMVTLRISVDKTFVPASVRPGAKDTRELGIRVFHAFVEPQ